MDQMYDVIMIGGGAAQFAYTFSTSFGMLHFMNLGFAAVLITAAISARGVGSSIGGLVPGFLADRIEPIYMQGVHMVLVGIFFVLAAATNQEIFVFLFMFFTGWAIGAQKGLCPTALANWTGTKNFGRIYGYTLLVLATLACLIPVSVGAYFDAVGNYSLPVTVVGVICLICGIACFLVRYPKGWREEQAAARAAALKNAPEAAAEIADEAQAAVAEVIEDAEAAVAEAAKK